MDNVKILQAFHDSVGIIVIPLIIALFAFTMPLIFQVITHINSKYSSQSISEMFESTRTYRLFWVISVLSIFYLFLIGIVSLSTDRTIYDRIMSWANWIGLFVAVAYVTITLFFIKTCIGFNSPRKLLTMIGQQYKDDWQGDYLKVAINNINYVSIKARFWKSKGWKLFKTFVCRGKRWLAHDKTVSDYGDRLTDLCKYAVNIKDKPLFLSIIHEINSISDKEKRVSFVSPEFSCSAFEQPSHQPLTNSFYKGVLEYYSHCAASSDFEETIIRNWLTAFNQKRFPYDKSFIEVVNSVVRSVEAGCIGIYEKYIRYSAFEYLFIQNLSTAAFIEGASGNDQMQVYDDQRLLWSKICDLHFLMNSFLLSRGHYKILKPLLSAHEYFQGHLYALSPHEVLACYSNCKDKYHIGGYGFWNNQEMFGREDTDADMLEKYTVAMMLINAPQPKHVKAIASDNCVKRMKESKETLKKYVRIVKANKDMSTMFPDIKDVNFDALFDDCIKAFDEGLTLAVHKEKEYEEQPGFWSALVGSVESFFCSTLKQGRNTELANLYSVDVPEESKRLLEYDALSVFRNFDWMPRGLKDRSKKGILDSIRLQEMTILMNKRYVYYYGEESTFHLQRHYEIVFDKRIAYLAYSSISNMKIRTKIVHVGDFERFFKSYTKGRLKDYMIIDTECRLSTSLETETDTSGIKWTYKGADYKRIYLDARDMKDVPLFEVFRNTLLIIRKEDYPSLYKVDDCEPSVTFEDCSDSAKGMAAIAVTITPNMEMRYYRRTKVLMVQLER